MSQARNDYPSAALFVELQGLLKKRDKTQQYQRAWEILRTAGPNSDFPVLVDFALENSLILPCDLNKGLQTTSWLNPIDGSEMIWIPPGPFLVGRDKHRAICGGFSLARYPVTNAQFKRFLNDSGYQPPASHPDADKFLAHWEDGAIPDGKEKHPVVYISYLDSLYYCRWAGLHLPTEWLWEKAARGSDGRNYPWGNQAPWGKNIRKIIHVSVHGATEDDTVEVGLYPDVRTPYGCEDLIGNVSEWCHRGTEDYGAMPTDWPEMPLEEDGKGPYTAVRGSCFYRIVRRRMSAWHRRRLSVYRRNQWTGFRPALLANWRPGS